MQDALERPKRHTKASSPLKRPFSSNHPAPLFFANSSTRSISFLAFLSFSIPIRSVLFFAVSMSYASRYGAALATARSRRTALK